MKVCGVAPAERAEGKLWHVLTEESAIRKALDAIRWGWLKGKDRGYHIRLSEHPECVKDITCIRRHKKSGRPNTDQVGDLIKRFAKGEANGSTLQG